MWFLEAALETGGARADGPSLQVRTLSPDTQWWVQMRAWWVRTFLAAPPASVLVWTHAQVCAQSAGTCLPSLESGRMPRLGVYTQQTGEKVLAVAH